MPKNENFWRSVELLRVAGLDEAEEPFCHVNRHEDPLIVKAFGSQEPGCSSYLLHGAPGREIIHPVPVLLVHGAALNANSWAIDLTGAGSDIAGFLSNHGFQVFAVTFSHPHGDNYIQARQLAHAVEVVCQRTGASQVDLVCHSKGGIAARCWLQGLIDVPYPGTVRRIFMMGVPNLGTDQAFRHPAANVCNHFWGLNSVVAYDRMWNMGILADTSRQAIYRDGTFLGQAQLLYRWKAEIPLDPLEVDAGVVYHGGWGVFGHSRGIKQALEDGGHLIETLDQKPFPAELGVAILAGNNHFIGTIPGEASAPSDGLVFTASALHDRPFVDNGCRILARDVLPVNHLEMLYDERAAGWLYSGLLQP